MLSQYIFTALLAWNPSTGARSTTPDTVLQQYADIIDQVCESPLECLTMASVASEESRFAPNVLSGKCNLTHIGCDHGRSYGAWQMFKYAWRVNLAHLSPLEQAQLCIPWLRKFPYRWSTYRTARSKALQWLRTHQPN